MAATNAIMIPIACVIALPGSLIDTDIQVSPLPSVCAANELQQFRESCNVVINTTLCILDITLLGPFCQEKGFLSLPPIKKGPDSRPLRLLCLFSLTAGTSVLYNLRSHCIRSCPSLLQGHRTERSHRRTAVRSHCRRNPDSCGCCRRL